MKQILFLTILSVFLFSCSKDIAYENTLEKSQQAFEKFKQQNDNSYIFVLTTHSWTNYRTETTLYVKNGKVVGRDFIAKKGEWINNQWEFTIMHEFSETQQNLNTHEGVYEAITLDEVYNKAKNELLKVDDKTNIISFETENNGMISNVGYTPKNCADDCFNGYTISSIEPFQ